MFKRSLIAALACFAFAGSAIAQTNNVTVLDNQGNPQTMQTKNNSGVHTPSAYCADSAGNDATDTTKHACKSALTQGTNTVGDVGSAAFSATCTTLTLPTGGGNYAANLLIAGATPAALTCVVARYVNGPVSITKARIFTSNPSVTNAQFRVHVHTSAPTYLVANGGTFSGGLSSSGHFCALDVTLGESSGGTAFSDGAEGAGTPVTGSTCTRVISDVSQQVYVDLESEGSSYAWLAGQTIVVGLEGWN